MARFTVNLSRPYLLEDVRGLPGEVGGVRLAGRPQAPLVRHLRQVAQGCLPAEAEDVRELPGEAA